ncbi:hypothetical protein GCM10010306_092390 [Streptomyces umbrinus]|nr:hypothetical protein GCM10010306_092390 [Streptomyces umbrinus]
MSGRGFDAHSEAVGDQVNGEKDVCHMVGDRPEASTAVIAVDARGNAPSGSYGARGHQGVRLFHQGHRHRPESDH